MYNSDKKKNRNLRKKNDLSSVYTIDSQQAEEYIIEDPNIDIQYDAAFQAKRPDYIVSYYDEIVSYDSEKKMLVFKTVNHSGRVRKSNNQITDGEVAKFLNVALEYFDYRCALSGEEFFEWDERVNRMKCNLSAEHMIPLTAGGSDIVPNLFPTVLHYNLQKHGYNPLDYWKQAKDIKGNSIYNPYRLLKVINYMIKTSTPEARACVRGGDIKKFKKLILEDKNAIDIFLEEVVKENHMIMYSDTQTTITVDGDGKKVLAPLPPLERIIPIPKEQNLDKKRGNPMEIQNTFIEDAIREFENSELADEIIKDVDGKERTVADILKSEFQMIRGNVSSEIEIRSVVLKKLEELGLQENQYTIANSLVNTSFFIQMVKDGYYDIGSFIEEGLEALSIKGLTNEESLIAISSFPEVLYSEEMINRIVLWKKYRSESFNELLHGNVSRADNFVDALLVLNEYHINVKYLPWSQEVTIDELLDPDLIINAKLMPFNNEKNAKKKLKVIKGIIEDIIGYSSIGNLLGTLRTKNNRPTLEKAMKDPKDTEGKPIFDDTISDIIIDSRRTRNIVGNFMDVLEVLKEFQINVDGLRWSTSANNTVDSLLKQDYLIEKKLIPTNDSAETESELNIAKARITTILGENIGMRLKDLRNRYRLEFKTALQEAGYSEDIINQFIGEKKKGKDVTIQAIVEQKNKQELGDNIPTGEEFSEIIDKSENKEKTIIK